MRRRSQLLMSLSLLALVATLACGGAEKPADEHLTGDLTDLMPAAPASPVAAEAAPERTTILFADPNVVVSRLQLEPGDTMPDHRGEDRVLLCLAGDGLTVSRAELETVRTTSAGDALAIGPGEATFTNQGEEPIIALLTSRSEVPLEDLPAGTLPVDPEVMADGGELMLNTDAVAVVRTTLAPGDALPVVGAPLWIVFAEDGATLAVRQPDLDEVRVPLAAGEVLVRKDPDTALTNVGDAPASLFVILYRAAPSPMEG